MNLLKYIVLPCCLVGLLSCSDKNKSADASGSFEATEIIVSAEANGKLLQFNLLEGQELGKGQIVGIIDSTQLYLQKMSLLKNAKGVRVMQPNIATQTAAIQEQIATLERERKRMENLIAANAGTTKQLDDINSQIEVLQRQLSANTSTLQKNSEQISAQSSSMDIQIAQLDDLLRKCTINSPIPGTVINKYAEAGELVVAGTPLFKIADLNNLFLRAYITYEQFLQIKLNDSVIVKTDGGKTYDGKITWISSQAEFTPKTVQTKNERENQVYAVKIAVKNDGLLKIGMYGEVQLRIEN
ncbi:MAG: HlyD family efflux transporter periplasmic adaptor subunit [Dysgonamonadaceae bacterium]|nr:HlyD family efflux transporter periplasmic adaptor subunit [Dysgonamonadaceae bacterium]